MHRQFFRLLCQNPVYVKTHCNDLNKPFHFACRNIYQEKAHNLTNYLVL